jgi:hypothetical protein
MVVDLTFHSVLVGVDEPLLIQGEIVVCAAK